MHWNKLVIFNSPEPKAHRWAYSMLVEPSSVRPSVRPSILLTTISPQLVSQLQSNFIRSIIGVWERLHKVLGQVGSELWFPWQQIAPIWEKCEHYSAYIFDRIFFILAGNEDSHKISDEFEIRVDSTLDCGVSCPWAFEKIPIDLQWERCCEHSSANISDQIFFILAGNKDNHKISDEFEIQQD